MGNLLGGVYDKIHNFRSKYDQSLACITSGLLSVSHRFQLLRPWWTPWRNEKRFTWKQVFSSFPIKRADPKEFSCSSISHPVAPSPLLIVRSLEGSKGLVVVVGRPWRVETPVEAQVEGARDILPQVGRPLVVVVVVVEPLLVETVHTLVVTEQARLQNALLKRRSICREVKISRRRLVGDQWQLEPTRCRGGLT